jgi:alkylated DNA repair protein (DNA oxidative demethylase)
VNQLELIADQVPLPPGFLYRSDFISDEEESHLANLIAGLQFSAVVMRGVAAKRRTAHFGRSYEFESFRLGPAPPIPEFLLPFRERAASLTSHRPDEFAEALVSEYSPGAAIGWHRDAPPFGVIVGISLLAACTMKFRPWPVPAKGAVRGSKRTRPLSQTLEPRSVYVIDGKARSNWQHHIPPAETLRYSVTFRTLRSGGDREKPDATG